MSIPDYTHEADSLKAWLQHLHRIRNLTDEDKDYVSQMAQSLGLGTPCEDIVELAKSLWALTRAGVLTEVHLDPCFQHYLWLLVGYGMREPQLEALRRRLREAAE